MSDINATLAALVGSRLCHDLISPVGAIQNGLELLALTSGESAAPEMALIQDSCASAAARIRFFRVAFGSAASDQNMSQREISSTLAGVAKGERLHGEWLIEGDQPRVDVQLAFLAHMCCESALPQGGTIRCERLGGALTITGTGPRLNVDPDVWGFLAGHGDSKNITPDRVQFALLSVLAKARGARLHVVSDDKRVRITVN